MFNYIYGGYNYRVTDSLILVKVGRSEKTTLKVLHFGQTMVQAMHKCLALSIAVLLSLNISTMHFGFLI